MFKLLAVFILLNVKIHCTEIGTPTIDLPLGKLQGYVKEIHGGKKIFVFEGIPYAKPPVGKHRLREPIPIKPWAGTWIANTTYKCLQGNYDPKSSKGIHIEGDEDCLYLNIYTPEISLIKTYDVIVYIHEGTFMFGSGNIKFVEEVLAKDVIFVTINYRVGPLGFLTTEDDVVPGNNGLKDQNLALRWINEFIEFFGGNPNSVTLVGNYAGAASVHLHYFTPESQGLFHRGISHIGAALCPWVLMENGLAKTMKISRMVGCPDTLNNTKMMVECLRRRPAKQIIETVKHLWYWLEYPMSPFGAVIDTWSRKPFLPDHPYNLLTNKKESNIPWIVSLSGSENIYLTKHLLLSELGLKQLETRWEELIPFLLDYNNTVSPEMLTTVGNKIRNHYVNDKQLNKDILSKIMTDRLFNNGILKSAKLQKSGTTAPVYLYIQDYKRKRDTSGSTLNKESIRQNEDDVKMTQFFINLITSFAEGGIPNISQWEPLSKTLTDLPVYLNLSSPEITKIEKQNIEFNEAFWDSLPIMENEKIGGGTVKDEL